MAQGADPAGVTVAECATAKEVATARPEWSDEEALRVMAGEPVGRLPVTDEQGRLLGVVTLSSLLLRSPRAGAAVETAKTVSKRSARAA
jgi:CBS domain-containing protein